MAWNTGSFQVNVLLGTSQLMHYSIKPVSGILRSVALSYMVLMKGLREKCYGRISKTYCCYYTMADM